MEIRENMSKAIKGLIEERLKDIAKVRREINLIKAGGDLSKFINLNDGFDETHDAFFDEVKEEMRLNTVCDMCYDYDDGEFHDDCEDDCVEKVKEIRELSNNEVYEKLDSIQLIEYAAFLLDYCVELEEELGHLRGK